MKKLRVILILGCFFVGTDSVLAQQNGDPLSPLITKLAASSVQTRAKAFYEILALASHSNTITDKVHALMAVYPGDAKVLQAALVNLLILENTDTTINSLNTSEDDEASGEFYVDVIESVVSLKSSALMNVLIPALLPSITNGGMVTDALASFGPPALDPVLNLVYDPDVEKRHAATYTLMTMLGKPQFASLYTDTTSQSKIRAGFRVALNSFTGEDAHARVDFQTFVDDLSHIPVGDLNADGLVNCSDLAIIKASFGRSVGQTGFDIRADVNGDGVVNILDLSAEAKLLPAGTKCQ